MTSQPDPSDQLGTIVHRLSGALGAIRLADTLLATREHDLADTRDTAESLTLSAQAVHDLGVELADLAVLLDGRDLDTIDLCERD